MAIVVQNNTGTQVGANSYISLAEFKAYHTARAVVAVTESTYDDTAIEGALVVSFDYINSYRYRGSRLTLEQESEFPRDYLYDVYGNPVEGVPTKVKNAQAELALFQLTTGLYVNPEIAANGRAVVETSSKVGPLEETIKYATSGSVATIRAVPAADRLLRDFLQNTGNRVYR